ncbi:hypothetical protein COY32_04810 [candidate division WWE3 bacterium CG_4_10_14_0_2_um_filter_41_14]|uniref:Uncharacterized protein n=1 Tax=candidate division WWE3 bacterium CG_4_10_14_0_2_um_filter_41_14 TaxID=1975072 RepID=A0A2M7THE5_UNCKA|nr:MAG: hypothetical protein COY32_04810 [candidate division WWE3 bacterium CG_4_10_14_0_2_um_filter_41_14]
MNIVLCSSSVDEELIQFCKAKYGVDLAIIPVEDTTSHLWNRRVDAVIGPLSIAAIVRLASPEARFVQISESDPIHPLLEKILR